MSGLSKGFPYHTVLPITNVRLERGARFEFAGGVRLEEKPAWLSKETMVDSLSKWDRDTLKECSSAFVVSYEAMSLGDPDPDWIGPKPKSIQESKYELCLLANLALWIIRPAPVAFMVVVHAPQFGTEPLAQRLERHSPLLCHPDDFRNRISTADITAAIEVHRGLAAVARDASTWTAIRAVWSALQMNIPPVRYPLLWIALEALFGPDDAREMTFRLSQRIALLLARDPDEGRELFSMARQGYSYRSKLVHGRWKDDADATKRMAEAEGLVRRSLSRIVTDEKLTKLFEGKGREAFLDDLVFTKGASTAT